MELETLVYKRDGGWSAPLPAALDSVRTVVLAFAAPSFFDDAAPLRDLRRAFPQARLIGCSSAGEIRGAEVHDESVSVSVARFARVTARTASASVGPGARSFAAGEELGRALAAPSLRAVLVLSEGLDVNGSELARGITSAIDPRVVVSGGLAADGHRFQRTWVLDDGTPAQGRVVALALFGDELVVGHGSGGGWSPFGIERRVTRSEGNVLFELDGKPALRLYKEYLGERALGLPSTALLFPLAMRESDQAGKQLVRTVLAIDEARQSLTFAGDIPAGSLVQLMYANLDRLIQGASDAAAQARLPLAARTPVLSVAVSCVGRRLVLAERTEEELEATAEILGAHQVGFYSYGELSPSASGGCDLHNQTMTLATFGERP